jgi:hypothetical protein
MSARTDDELWGELDTPGNLWAVRGGMGVGRPSQTVRAALLQARQISAEGGSPNFIVKLPDDEVVVPADQIYRLWMRLGLSVG